MTTKNLEFYYRKDKADRKQTCLILPVEYTQEAKIYPNRCRLRDAFIEVCSELGAYQMAAIAQQLILFTDALGLHYQRTGNPQCMGCDGMDHQAHFTGGKKERVVLDSPYHKYALDSTVWRSVWLPRSSDPYLPGITFGRLSIFYRSTANLEQLAERVSHLNFDLFSRDSTVEDYAAWLLKMNPKPTRAGAVSELKKTTDSTAKNNQQTPMANFYPNEFIQVVKQSALLPERKKELVERMELWNKVNDGDVNAMIDLWTILNPNE